jgi:hypothetical protein
LNLKHLLPDLELSFSGKIGNNDYGRAARRAIYDESNELKKLCVPLSRANNLTALGNGGYVKD